MVSDSRVEPKINNMYLELGILYLLLDLYIRPIPHLTVGIT